MHIPYAAAPMLAPRRWPGRDATSGLTRLLAKRADGNSNKLTLIGVGVVVSLVALALLAIGIRITRSRYPNPTYIPTKFLKQLWCKWNVPSYGARYQQTGGEDTSETTYRQRTSSNTANNGPPSSSRNSTLSTATGVGRNTSIRSVMTLPAYRPKASTDEQVLGREGERDGIDMVVEMPSAEDEEALREDEMAALYQIRVARRRQLAEREERRQARREARDRNDGVALQDIRQRTRDATNNNAGELEELRNEHQRIKQTRQRAVSSVSYHDLGVARADGTRLRAGSVESEQVGLLSDAASIALSLQSSRPSGHRRDRSASSAISIESEMPPGRGRSRTNSRPETPNRLSPRPQAGSSPELVEADLGEARPDVTAPPEYEDVSLDEDGTGLGMSRSATPQPQPSRSISPYPDDPPNYSPSPRPSPRISPAEERNQRLSAHIEDLAAETQADETHPKRSSRGVGGVPQLPSLRLTRLPQIVVEPSSAWPEDDEEERGRSRY